jgi:hypothetical protein
MRIFFKKQFFCHTLKKLQLSDFLKETREKSKLNLPAKKDKNSSRLLLGLNKRP